MLSFDILTDNLLDVIARHVPLFFNLGSGEHPKPNRRRMFYYAWTVANGAPPARSDRMPLNVFVHRMATVTVRDTARSFQDAKRAIAPYSVIAKILEWETGASDVHLINRSADQGRHHSKPLGRKLCGDAIGENKPLTLGSKGSLESALAGVENHNTAQGAANAAVKGILPQRAVANKKSPAAQCGAEDVTPILGV